MSHCLTSSTAIFSGSWQTRPVSDYQTSTWYYVSALRALAVLIWC